jgi:transglutaminase-like putative cysteine protease
MPFYRIKHITRYTYQSPVMDCTNQVLLYPIFDSHLEVRNHEFHITYNPVVEVFTDYFGNKVGVFTIIKPHQELTIVSDAEVVTKVIDLPADDQPASLQWQQLSDLKYETPFMDFLVKEEFENTSDVYHVVKAQVDWDKTPFQNAITLAAYVYNNFEYKKGVTDVLTKTDEVWKLKAGVCQDFAHILLVMLRMAGIPARYTSGYICPKEQVQRGEGATHAWVEAYLPDYGWIGLDPTNNCIVNDGHVRLAVGRSFDDCTPVKGTYKGSGEHLLEVSVDIENGQPHKHHDPTFSTVMHQPTASEISLNSYQRDVKIKQQQQQQ